MIQVEITKTGSENPLATIRKFTRRVQGTGLIRTVRSNRYFSRATSKTVKKKRALKMIGRREEFKKLIKEGKIADPAQRRQNFSRENTQAQKPAEGMPVAR
jgi:ribosomal protein S21